MMQLRQVLKHHSFCSPLPPLLPNPSRSFDRLFRPSCPSRHRAPSPLLPALVVGPDLLAQSSFLVCPHYSTTHTHTQSTFHFPARMAGAFLHSLLLPPSHTLPLLMCWAYCATYYRLFTWLHPTVLNWPGL